MDGFLSQQAIEVIRMIWKRTQEGHVVAFTPGMGKDMIVSVDDAHTHSTGIMMMNLPDEEVLRRTINGLYRVFVTDEGLSWVSPEK